MQTRSSNAPPPFPSKSMGSHALHQVSLMPEHLRATESIAAFRRVQCDVVWDSANASFSPCALQYIALFPALAIFLIGFGFIVRPLVNRRRPDWTRPFVQEFPNEDEGWTGKSSRSLVWTVSLATLAIVGVASNIVLLVSSPKSVSTIVILLAWISVSFLVTTSRPRACPMSWLVFYVTELIVEISFFTSHGSLEKVGTSAHAMTACACAGSIVVILMFPFRSANLSSDEISVVGTTPSVKYRSPEDDLQPWQFLTVSWMAPMISTGKRRTLQEGDVWTLPLQFQIQRVYEYFRDLKGSVLGRLVHANAIDLLIIAFSGLMELLCESTLPLLLQQLLSAMEHRNSNRQAVLTYAVLSLVVRACGAQISVLNVWYGRRCYERSRGQLTMMVYEKSLSRKNVASAKKESNVDHQQMNGSGTPDYKSTKGGRFWDRLHRCFRNVLGTKKPKAKPKQHASIGKILHIVQGDVNEVSQRLLEIDQLVKHPVALVIAALYIWRLLGPSCFLGLLVVLASTVINFILMRFLVRMRRKRKAVTDARVQTTAQFIEAIRHLRWYGWERQWLDQVQTSRIKELSVRIKTVSLAVTVRWFNTLGSGMLPVVALYSYTILAGHTLSIDVIFPALQLFQLLDGHLKEIPNQITTLLNAHIAIGRIEDFMAEPERMKDGEDSPGKLEVLLSGCDFSWPEQTTPVLTDVNLSFEEGLTVICGKVGTGKTALLQAILGELDTLKGRRLLPDTMVGYCAQTPWLQSKSLRDNILFFSAYDETRYRRVLDACELLPDFDNFKHGDLSFIGENGIGLSGGQKARVALARAVYNPAEILLLDDPLAALDHGTAEKIVRKLFFGPLLQGRIVVLVTHRTDLVRGIADQLIEVSDGSAKLSNLIPALDTKIVGADRSAAPIDEVESSITKDSSAAPSKFMEEEHRADWSVKVKVYWTFIQAGGLQWWMLEVITLTAWRLIGVAHTWFVKAWGEAYGPIALIIDQTFGQARQLVHGHGTFSMPSSERISRMSFNPIKPLDGFPHPEDNAKPWLWAFFAISGIHALAYLAFWTVELVIMFCAARWLFQEVMKKVTNATFRFYDVTPVGRLMNRLTADMSTVDGRISQIIGRVAMHVITWVSCVIVIASINPVFLLFSIGLMGTYILIFRQFLPTSQSLRRLEKVSLSPIFSDLGEVLLGLTTVRAFRAGGSFRTRMMSVVDRYQAMDHFYWSLQSWVMYRFENLAALSTFALTALAVILELSPGLTAFMLVTANAFVRATNLLCQRFGNLQMDFVSVERVEELLHIDQETTGTLEPPASWPRYGADIQIENTTIRYAPQLEPVLIDVTLHIPGGSTTAIIGRTGSGKSTLAQAILSVVRPDTGSITIDGISANDVSVSALRSRITFIAQDPVLFPGTVRHNLDPVSQFSDEECASALDTICTRHRQPWTLSTTIEPGGRNLSQGQRQLIGIARAVLRRSAVVILDEATASIDSETSMDIQGVLREQLKGSTIITIAHKVDAVRDAEFVIVTENGRVVRQGRVEDVLSEQRNS